MNKKVNLNNKITQSIFYNSFGTITYLFAQWLLTFIVVWISGYETAGILSLATSIATTFNVIAGFSVRNYQSSDIEGKYSEKTYIYTRFFTCFLALVMTLFYSLTKHYNFFTFSCITIYILFKINEAIIDMFHGSLQKKWKFDVIGLSFIIRGLILITVFTLTLLLTNNLLLSLSLMTLALYLELILYDYKKYKIEYKDFGKFNKYDAISLILECLPLVLSGVIANYIVMYPKVLLEEIHGAEILGYYSSVATPAVIIQIAVSFIYTPLISLYAEYFNNNESTKIKKSIIKMLLIIILIILASLILSHFFAEKILTLLFTKKISPYTYLFDTVLILSGLTATVWFLNMILVVLRKQTLILFTSLISLLFVILTANSFIDKYYLSGINYTLIISNAISIIFYLITIFLNLNPKPKKFYIRLMGGLGNQMFQYACVRNLALENNGIAYIDLSGITNKTHNIYSLNHLNISKNVKIINSKKSLKGLVCYLIFGFFCKFFGNNQNAFNIFSSFTKNLNKDGIYCVPDGYIKLEKSSSKNNYLVGYFQSSKFFHENKTLIKKELQIKEKINEINKPIIDKIIKTNSVCIHIRRGDYLGDYLQVCNNKYYYDAIKEMNKHIKNPYYFIFSDDIKWVKENMKFPKNTVFVDNNNPNYEELNIMSKCKNFIMSNSTFSYWAQFLSNNENKIVIAPNKWFLNEKRVDIYEKDWKLIEIDTKVK